jgi:hypothetical protein
MGPGRVMSSIRPQMISALSWEPAIGHRPTEPLAASAARASRIKNSANPPPAPSAAITSLELTI